MPKRKNPFGDTAPLQLKTHVGFKEAATEEEKEEVYAKTKAILFQGANPQARILQNGTNATPQSAPVTGIGQPSNDGKRNGLVKHFANGSTSSTVGKQTRDHSVGVVCRCCMHKSELLKNCSYCERAVCDNCLKACCVCAQVFCLFCSVLNYDRSEVQSFCLNCLPTCS